MFDQFVGHDAEGDTDAIYDEVGGECREHDEPAPTTVRRKGNKSLGVSFRPDYLQEGKREASH